jgi:hypothetical protein
MTSYGCATLSCTPEYRDWRAEFGGQVLHVTSPAILPSSIYEVAVVPNSCAGAEESCEAASVEVAIATGRWGDVETGVLNAADIAAEVDKVRDVLGAFGEPQGLLQPDQLNPIGFAVSALDVAVCIDAVKGNRYPHAGPAVCP